jgi:hypothetical protein
VVVVVVVVGIVLGMLSGGPAAGSCTCQTL